MLEDKIEQVLALGFLVETKGMCGVVQKHDGGCEAPLPKPGVGDSDDILSVATDFVDASLKIKLD